MKRLYLALAFAFAAGLLVGGCGPAGSETKTGPANTAPTDAPKTGTVTPPTNSGPEPTKATTPEVKATSGTASLTGKVKYNGEPPKRRPINFGPEQKCHEHHTTPPLEETLVVSPERGVQWVMVRIAGKVPGTFAPPTKPAILDQRGCVFLPHILPVMPGQEIEIRNSDPILHNVRCEATLNPSFNRNMPKVGDTMKVKFDSAEMDIKIKCDVHFWMGGFIHVVPHPFFAVTDANGAFTIEKLPPGSYKLEAWHEKLGKQSQDITVKDGEVKAIEFTFQPK